MYAIFDITMQDCNSTDMISLSALVSFDSLYAQAVYNKDWQYKLINDVLAGLEYEPLIDASDLRFICLYDGGYLCPRAQYNHDSQLYAITGYTVDINNQNKLEIMYCLSWDYPSISV